MSLKNMLPEPLDLFHMLLKFPNKIIRKNFHYVVLLFDHLK